MTNTREYYKDYDRPIALDRIGKRVARKYYNEGKTIYVAPYKANINSPWGLLFKLPNDRDFDKCVNEYTYFNCNSAMGVYCKYYVEVN